MKHQTKQLVKSLISKKIRRRNDNLEASINSLSEFSTNNENLLFDDLSEGFNSRIKCYLHDKKSLIISESKEFSSITKSNLNEKAQNGIEPDYFGSVSDNISAENNQIISCSGSSPSFTQNKKILFSVKKRKIHICIYPGCFKKFREKGNLVIHIKQHLKIRPFKCDFPDCIRTFTTSGNLKLHKNVHKSDSFDYKCNNCDKSYYVKKRLDIHLRTHDGNKPFKCPIEGCHKSFNEKGVLKTHIRVHTGERPYKCNIIGCDKRFKTLTHLKNHLESHNRK